jgi:Fe2+ or Zn2+ uptake regulation protein
MEGTEHNRTTREEDDGVQSAVLRTIIDLHPTRLTAEEVAREVSGEAPGFAELDAVERAIRDLAAAGLLHRAQDLVDPSRAALRFSELLDR